MHQLSTPTSSTSYSSSSCSAPSASSSRRSSTTCTCCSASSTSCSNPSRRRSHTTNTHATNDRQPDCSCIAISFLSPPGSKKHPIPNPSAPRTPIPRSCPRSRPAVSNPSPVSSNLTLTHYSKPRNRWATEQGNYLFQLMELAMRQLGRALEPRDFPAVTEAVHRQFAGTVGSDNKTYTMRGYNTLHTYATKGNAMYDALRAQLGV